MSEKLEKQSAPARPRATSRDRLKFLIRVIFSAALLFYLVAGIPAEDRIKILTAIADSIPLFIGIAILMTAAERIMSAAKWFWLLRLRDKDIRAWPVFRVFFVTSFFGYFLPTSVGGDVLRAFSLGRMRGDMVGSASSVVLDRAFGFLGLLLIAAVSLVPALGSAISLADATLIWAVTFTVLIAVVVLASRRCHRWLSRVAKLESGGAVKQPLLKLSNAFSSFAGDKPALIKIFLFSLVVQFVRVAINMVVGFAVGVDVDPVLYFIYVPIINIATLLPVSIAGIGVREAGFVLFFAPLGVPAYTCISLSLIVFGLGLLSSVPGAVIFAIRGMGRKSEETSF